MLGEVLAGAIPGEDPKGNACVVDRKGSYAGATIVAGGGETGPFCVLIPGNNIP